MPEVRERNRVAMRYFVTDLECTCHLNQPELDVDRDIIQIGSVPIEETGEHATYGAGLSIGYFDHLVKPVRHPKLSTFCTELTGISQYLVDKAQSLEEVIALWYMTALDPSYNPNREKLVLVSWGDFDRKILVRDWPKKYKYPFEGHLNLKTCFAQLEGSRPKGLGKAIKSLGWTFAGRAHEAYDDAFNTARILRMMITDAPQNLIVDWK